MIILINIHVTYLIFNKIFKCTHIILIDYLLIIAGRLFRYLFLRILIIWKHFLHLLLVIFVVNFAFINVLYNNESFDVNNVKTVNGTFSLTIMTEDISNYGKEVFIPVSV